jgi:hypothetical protein
MFARARRSGDGEGTSRKKRAKAEPGRTTAADAIGGLTRLLFALMRIGRGQTEFKDPFRRARETHRERTGIVPT